VYQLQQLKGIDLFHLFEKLFSKFFFYRTNLTDEELVRVIEACEIVSIFFKFNFFDLLFEFLGNEIK